MDLIRPGYGFLKIGKLEDDRTSILVLTYRSSFLGPVNAFSQIGQGFSENHVFYAGDFATVAFRVL